MRALYMLLLYCVVHISSEYLNISTTEYSNPVLSVSLIPAVTEAAEEHVTISRDK